MIKSDRNLKLNEMKAELKAIEEAENLNSASKPTEQKRWTKSEARGVTKKMRSTMSKLQRTIDEGKARQAKMAKGKPQPTLYLIFTHPEAYMPTDKKTRFKRTMPVSLFLSETGKHLSTGTKGGKDYTKPSTSSSN